MNPKTESITFVLSPVHKWLLGGAGSIICFLLYFILHLLLTIEGKFDNTVTLLVNESNASHERVSLIDQRVKMLENKGKQQTYLCDTMPADIPKNELLTENKKE